MFLFPFKFLVIFKCVFLTTENKLALIWNFHINKKFREMDNVLTSY